LDEYHDKGKLMEDMYLERKHYVGVLYIVRHVLIVNMPLVRIEASY